MKYPHIQLLSTLYAVQVSILTSIYAHLLHCVEK